MFISPYLINAFLYCPNRCFILKYKLAESEHINMYIANLYDDDLDKVRFNDFEIDSIDKEQKIIYEYKKTCSNFEGNKFQLIYYLYLTKNIYKNYFGVLICIETETENKVYLNNETEEILLSILDKIEKLNTFDTSLLKKDKCQECGLYDFCHA